MVAKMLHTCIGVSDLARAEAFYRRRGYAPFGALENYPGEQAQGHRRAFLAKRFAS